YSDSGDCDICKPQGIVLSAIKQEHPNTMIYSFDINADYSLTNTIKDIYGIKSAPSIVIGDKVYSEFLNQEKLEKLLDKQEMYGASSQDYGKS
ncbi:MAG: hypothetical protein QXH80_01570, partial [Candidatus Nanoarchaeia archaeon]